MEPINLFATPDSMKDMQDYLAQFSGSEAVVANTCAYMMYNLMIKIYSDSEKADK